MAIHKKVRHHTNQTADAAQPVFSYPASPDLANVIVEAWLNRPYTYPMPGGPPETRPLKDALLDRDRHGNPTKRAYAAATAKIGDALKIDLTKAVVITEAEHDNDYFRDEDEVVFVLPDETLVAIPAPPPPFPVPPAPPTPPYTRLLEAAKFLMACTPNGI